MFGRFVSARREPLCRAEHPRKAPRARAATLLVVKLPGAQLEQLDELGGAAEQTRSPPAIFSPSSQISR